MTDREVQERVFEALETEGCPRGIGVAVEDGVVTLYGEVDSYEEMRWVEQAAKEVYGVKAVTDAMQVHSTPESMRRDREIALEAVWALEINNDVVPNDQIQTTVRDGWITLEGEVERGYQRQAVEDAVCCHPAIEGIINLIEVRQPAGAALVKHEIEDALRRSAEADAARITVDMTDSRVILKGGVRAWVEREDAERAARKAVGVSEVENRLLVIP